MKRIVKSLEIHCDLSCIFDLLALRNLQLSILLLPLTLEYSTDGIDFNL